MTDATVPYLRYDSVVVKKDGTLEPWFVNAFNNLTGRTGGEAYNAILGIINGQSQEQANTLAQLEAANAAAQAAIGASGSTETGQDSDSFSITTETFTTVLSVALNHAGGGNYSITAAFAPAVLATSPAVDGSGSFSGEWRILEGASVLASGSGGFTATSTFNGGEGGTPFYTNDIAFDSNFPTTATSYADVGSGAVTIALQLRRAPGTAATTVSDLFGSLLVVWS